MTQAPELLSTEPVSGVPTRSGVDGDPAACVAAAWDAWPRWATTPLANRVELSRRLANELRRDGEVLARLIAQETGKVLRDAHREVEGAIARVEIAVRAHGERCAQRKLDSALQGTTAVRHKPLGTIAVIAPFCQPLGIALGHILPALIAGNAVLYKPSERTAGVGAALGACATRAGFPTGGLQVVQGDGAIGQALVADEAVSGVLFTGSTQVGQHIARKMAVRPDRMLSLAMGGNNALVVWDTPLIADAAALVVQSAFADSGQNCRAARRLIVRDTMAEPLLAAIKDLADRLICGEPLAEPGPFMGPVIDSAVADGLTQSFIWLMSNGGRPVKHMQRMHDTLPFVSPAIIDVTGVAERPDVELFGPLLQVIRVADFDSAIAEANATRYGLVAGLIGGSPQEYNRFWANVRAGLIHWNRPTTTDVPAVPSGGLGLSGNHRASGYYTADSCAYPVASAELEQPRAMIGGGLAPPA